MLNALRFYVSDHPRKCDFYMDAITYAHYTRVNRITSLSPFKLTLSRIQPLVAIEAQLTLSNYPSPGLYRNARKAWLTRIVLLARKAMEKAQLDYKRNLDSNVRRPLPRVQAIDWVFLRKEYYNPEKKGSHKLSLIVEGPYHVVFVSQDTVVLDIENRHKQISRDQVARVPNLNQEVLTSFTTHLGEPTQDELHGAEKTESRPGILPHSDRGRTYLQKSLYTHDTETNRSRTKPNISNRITPTPKVVQPPWLRLRRGRSTEIRLWLLRRRPVYPLMGLFLTTVKRILYIYVQA